MNDSIQSTARLLVGVETACDSGVFKVDERLRVDEIHQRADRSVSSATISVRIDDDFDVEEARRLYHPDRRLVVMTDEPDVRDREMLFEGYPPVQTFRWNGRIGHEGEVYVFEAEHVFERLSCDRAALIYGRRMRNGAIEDGLQSDPPQFTGRSVPVTALPCIFNPDGVGNRAVDPLTVMTKQGDSRKVHLFTWDNEFAEKWTYATVLRYLVWFYVMHEGPVYEGNTFTVTEKAALGQRQDNTRLSKALEGAPISLVCEGTNLAEALDVWASSAGLHITAETDNVDGRPVTGLRVWAAEDGPAKELLLVRSGTHADGTPRYDRSKLSDAQVLQDNNTYRGWVSWDHRNMVNSPVVIGGIKQYEMTVELQPGWIPRHNLDNVSAEEREAAKALALTPEQVEELGEQTEAYYWFRRYHRRGSEFFLGKDTGRLWVLNEDGWYDAALYNRNAPFDNYQPFDFSTVTDHEITGAGSWTRRPRPFLPTITGSAESGSSGVWMETSFDGGVTWHQQSSGICILKDRAGVYFDCENPAEITPTGIDPAEVNMWYALIDQTFRVRVTAVIESDERLMGTYPTEESVSPTMQRNAMVIRRPRSFQFKSCMGTENILRELSDDDAYVRDDSQAIQDVARSLAEVYQGRDIRGAAVIPWLDSDYAPGDRISGIRGRHIRFGTTRAVHDHYPIIHSRRIYLYEGQYETELTLGMNRIMQNFAY
jgi:hypothetical protein